MKKLTFLIFLAVLILLPGRTFAQKRPNLQINAKDVQLLRSSGAQYALSNTALLEAKTMIGRAMSSPVEVPQPKDAAGYTHERHKQNYLEMQAAGILFQITKDERYARFVRELLLKYAALYPLLGRHPAATNDSYGKIFWQSLNESVWLVHTIQAYDCIYDWLSVDDRKTIEENIFRPMTAFFIIDQKSVFNRIHNHGTWMTAAVGMTGFVLNDTSLVSMALFGTEKNGKGGFLSQLNMLFSPDGYYTEGPYYHRYAIAPFYMFAQAIENNRPDLAVFQYRQGILKKALFSLLQMTTPSGQFLPMNDAMKMKTFGSPDMVLTLNLAYKNYSYDSSLLSIAKVQQAVSLSGAGVEMARDLAAKKVITSFPYSSLELRDGALGDEGGVGLLRFGPINDQMLVTMKYTGHGLSHGHFDKLSLMLYDQDRDQLQDYGFARFVNVDPKNGGRYLPENASFAMQSIAHNTVTVDERSHYQGNIRISEKNHADRHYFHTDNPNLQVMSAVCSTAYDGIMMQRTVLLMKDSSREKPWIIDIFRVKGTGEHTFDLPFYYMGQFMRSNTPYTSSAELQRPLGTSYGYQHLWKEAETRAHGMMQFSWLSGKRFYSVSTAADSQSTVYFVRIGANDPDMNLRREPAVIIRKTGAAAVFASVIEPHGMWDGTTELSHGAYSSVSNVAVLASNDEGTVVAVETAAGLKRFIMVSNTKGSDSAKHTVYANGAAYSWTGDAVIQ